MTNQEIADYIRKYKDSYSEESIRKQLINSGYSESEVNEAFRENSMMKTNETNNSLDLQSTNLDNVHYVGFWARVLALILDCIIVTAPLFLVYLIIFIFSTNEVITILTISIVSIIVYPVYEIIMVGKKGATLGKMVIRAKIVKANGEEIDMSSSALRFVGKIVSSLTLYIGYIMVAFTGKKQGLHDMIAKTYVIYKR